MASLADLLYGNLPTESDYLRDDPFYRSGIGISQIQTAPPRNNTEAFLIPFLQNAAAGGLAGYGRSNAANAAFQDARMSLAPYLSGAQAAQEAGQAVPASIAPFLSETMPDDFKIKDALQARAMAQYQQQVGLESQAAQELERLKQSGELQKALLPFSEMAREAKRAEKQDAIDIERGNPEVPTTLKTEIAEQKAIVDEAKSLGSTLITSGDSWAKMRSAAMFSGLDDDGVQARLADIGDRVLRSRTGTAAPEGERSTILKFIAGDKTVTPKRAGELILKFAEREEANALSKLNASTSSTAELRDSLSPRKTVNGRTYIKVPGGWQAE